jgi:hypothetical protein
MLHKLKDIAVPAVAVVGIIGLYFYAKSNDEYYAGQMQKRKETVCPSFLSIARSARDTLIVMRNETLCNSYVLDNLQ